MKRIASLCSAFVLFAAIGPNSSRASEGGGGSELILLPPRPACAHFVGGASADVRKAENSLATIKKRKGTAAQQKAAKLKLTKAKARLRAVQAGKC